MLDQTSDQESPSGYQVNQNSWYSSNTLNWNTILVMNFKATRVKFWLEKQSSYFKGLKSCKAYKTAYYGLLYSDYFPGFCFQIFKNYF